MQADSVDDDDIKDYLNINEDKDEPNDEPPYPSKSNKVLKK
jgi:hypothetical protein